MVFMESKQNKRLRKSMSMVQMQERTKSFKKTLSSAILKEANRESDRRKEICEQQMLRNGVFNQLQERYVNKRIDEQEVGLAQVDEQFNRTLQLDE